MTKTKVYCDHCGKEISTFTDNVNLSLDVGIDEIKTDLCGDCLCELVQEVRDFCTNATVAKGA